MVQTFILLVLLMAAFFAFGYQVRNLLDWFFQDKE